jgi:HEPN domain-containing protein
MTARKFIGQLRYNLSDIPGEYRTLAMHDERIAGILLNQGEYRHATYFLVQSMEKHVRATIYTRVDPNNAYYRERTRTHDVDALLTFLLEIIDVDDTVRATIQQQLDSHVLAETRFGTLHNDLRYLKYSDRHKSYSMLTVDMHDALHARERLQVLKRFLGDMTRL